MIEWIKFKGSTEEERKRELPKYVSILIRDPKATSGLNIYEVFLDDENKVSCPATFEEFNLIEYDCWATLNLPQEEKWERKEDFTNYNGEYNERMNAEFDNIYSILNELRKR